MKSPWSSDPHSRRFWLWMAIYCVAIIGGSFFVHGPPRPDAAHLAAALIPVVPVFLALFESYRRIRGMDELEQRIHVEGMLLALLGTTAIVLTAGLLQLVAGTPLFPIFWIWLPIFVLYGAGVWLGHRRYS